jgi:hypothetical protein
MGFKKVKYNRKKGFRWGSTGAAMSDDGSPEKKLMESRGFVPGHDFPPNFMDHVRAAAADVDDDDDEDDDGRCLSAGLSASADENHRHQHFRDGGGGGDPLSHEQQSVGNAAFDVS